MSPIHILLINFASLFLDTSRKLQNNSFECFKVKVKFASTNTSHSFQIRHLLPRLSIKHFYWAVFYTVDMKEEKLNVFDITKRICKYTYVTLISMFILQCKNALLYISPKPYNSRVFSRKTILYVDISARLPQDNVSLQGKKII